MEMKLNTWVDGIPLLTNHASDQSIKCLLIKCTDFKFIQMAYGLSDHQ